MQDIAGIQLSQETIANVLQLGGQYALPSAALLRAIYSGYRGRLPEGIGQIGMASVFAGVTALADNRQPNMQQLITDLTGNTLFTAGLLSFIAIYILRLPNFGILVDAIVGGILGGGAWYVWVKVLENGTMPNGADWPIWSAAVAVAGGAALFIFLRFALRQIGKLVRLATVLVIIGIIAILAAGGLYLFQQMTGTAIRIGG